MKICAQVNVIPLNTNLLSRSVIGKASQKAESKPSQKNFIESGVTKCDALRDLVPSVQFKKREKHPWRCVNFSKVASFSLQLY